MTFPNSKNILTGLLIALGVIAADQYTKTCMLTKLQGLTGALPLAPFFNIVMVWNRGMSFGMFNHGTVVSPWWLITVAVILAAVVANWLRRAMDSPTVIGCGMIIGGALGNVIDRLRYGAVVDFLDIYVGKYHWPAFNLADSAICVGALLVLCASLFAPKIAAKDNPTDA